VYNGGKKALAGGDDGALIFCNTDKKYSRSFKMHDGPINCLAITSDRHYAITGSDDRSLRVWDLGDVEHKSNWSWCSEKEPPGARILS
jgi:WD40 repeat protein